MNPVIVVYNLFNQGEESGKKKVNPKHFLIETESTEDKYFSEEKGKFYNNIMEETEFC